MENLQTLTLNDELQVICRGNISRLPALTSLTIPANVRLIESGISQCDNLTEIRFLGECPVFMDTAFCFWWMPDEYTIYVPDDQFDAYAAALKDANGAADHLKPSGQNALPHTQTKDSWFAFDAATGTITEYNEYYAFVEFPPEHRRCAGEDHRG